MERVIALVSGGLDSATLMYWAKSQGYYVYALSIDYFHRAPQERIAILKLANKAGIQLIETSIPFLKTARDLKSELDSFTYVNEVPDGFIPMRNLLFYATAFYYANLYGCHYILGGHLITDSLGFPDATTDFFHNLEDLVYKSQLSNQTNRIEILRPFAEMTKSQVIQLGEELKVPFELTWSCYQHDFTPCGDCQACWERAKAFTEAGIIDPLLSKSNQEYHLE